MGRYFNCGSFQPVGVKLDALFGSLGMTPHFANGGHGGEVMFGIIGIIVVLVAGFIWRKRALGKAAHSESAA